MALLVAYFIAIRINWNAMKAALWEWRKKQKEAQPMEQTANRGANWSFSVDSFQSDWTLEVLQVEMKGMSGMLKAFHLPNLSAIYSFQTWQCAKNFKLIRETAQQQSWHEACWSFVLRLKNKNRETFTSSVITSDLQLPMFTIKICASLNCSLVKPCNSERWCKNVFNSQWMKFYDEKSRNRITREKSELISISFY